MSSQITITYGNRTFAPFNTARFMEFLQTHKKEERPPPVDIMQDMYKNLWRPENLNQVGKFKSPFHYVEEAISV